MVHFYFLLMIDDYMIDNWWWTRDDPKNIQWYGALHCQCHHLSIISHQSFFKKSH